MFRRLRRKPTKQSSALKGQKPKRRSDSSSQDKEHSWFTPKRIAILAGVTIATGIVLSKKNQLTSVWNHATNAIGTVLVLAPSEWTIQMASPDGTPLGDDVKREILKVASGILKSGSPDELETLSHAIEGIGSLENLHVVRPQYATIVISAGIREPVLLVQAGPKVRYLTADGTVYGDSSLPSSNQSGNTPSILVSGIFESRAANLQLDRSARLVTTQDEQAVLRNVIALWRLCANQNIILRTINYQKFRGFDVKIDDGSEVILGSAPFEYKVEKLVGIFTKLRKQGVAASRIELDYDGKAFIKERKL